MMKNDLPRSAQRVQTALHEKGLNYPVQMLPVTARTALDAASAIGCEVAQIVKSLLFCTASLQPILVLVSGSNQVSEQKLAKLMGEKVNKADAEWTRQITGFAIGGIPPIGHQQVIDMIVIDEDLLMHEILWAAAGTPHTVFCLPANEIQRLTGAKVMNIKRE